MNKVENEIISAYSEEQGIQDGILLEIHDEKINLMTSNLKEKLFQQILDSILLKANREIKKRIDWFYSFEFHNKKIFLVLNNSGKFTLMLGEDY